MESSSLVTREGIVSENDSDSEHTSNENLLDIETFLRRIETLITEIQELMRAQNNLHGAAETAGQEERRRRNSWIGWGKWIVLGLLALVLDKSVIRILGAISLGFAVYWHNKK